MVILSLLLAFLSIGIVSFGGGYAMLPLFEHMVVHQHEWLSMDRFVDMIAISQVTPGPIAINSATFIGYQTAGFLGAFVSTVGVVFIPVGLILTVAHYDEAFRESIAVKRILRGLRPALAGLIIASAISLGSSAIIDITGILIILFLLFLLVKVRVHPILVIVISGVIGMIFYA